MSFENLLFKFSGSSKASTHGGNMKKHMFSHSRSLTITATTKYNKSNNSNNNKTNNSNNNNKNKMKNFYEIFKLNLIVWNFSNKNSLSLFSYANCVGYFYKYITTSLDE
jgi:hypothetical protein